MNEIILMAKKKVMENIYIWEEGNIYIGPLKNDLRHGKGIEYYANGNIRYEGNYTNDNFDGFEKIWI